MNMVRHMTINIAGILGPRWKRKSLRGLFEDEDGRILSNTEAREMLSEMLAEGKKYFPIGDCQNFDYQKGCPGHSNEKDKP